MADQQKAKPWKYKNRGQKRRLQDQQRWGLALVPYVEPPSLGGSSPSSAPAMPASHAPTTPTVPGLGLPPPITPVVDLTDEPCGAGGSSSSAGPAVAAPVAAPATVPPAEPAAPAVPEPTANAPAAKRRPRMPCDVHAAAPATCTQQLSREQRRTLAAEAAMRRAAGPTPWELNPLMAAAWAETVLSQAGTLPKPAAADGAAPTMEPASSSTGGAAPTMEPALAEEVAPAVEGLLAAESATAEAPDNEEPATKRRRLIKKSPP